MEDCKKELELEGQLRENVALNVYNFFIIKFNYFNQYYYNYIIIIIIFNQYYYNYYNNNNYI